MKKEVYVVSSREKIADVIPKIISEGKPKIIYFDEELKEEGSSKIYSGKYTISLEDNVVIGFDKAMIIHKKITKTDRAAVYLRPKDAESAVYIVLP